MAWLENSGIGHAMRESGVWTYGVVNLLHILSVASLFGSLLVLDLRLMGRWRRTPLAAISEPTVPIATAGFMMAILTGICLLATKATEYLANPFLFIKFAAIGLGMLNVGVLHYSQAWQQHKARELTSREHSQLAVMGAISLLCWLTAVSAGRMIGYW
jgi:hypothetical protein